MGKYHCNVDLQFDWFGISCMTTDSFCFYLQNRLIQTSQTGGQRDSDTSSFSIPWLTLFYLLNGWLENSPYVYYGSSAECLACLYRRGFILAVYSCKVFTLCDMVVLKLAMTATRGPIYNTSFSS
jgi:hypothetical protein